MIRSVRVVGIGVALLGGVIALTLGGTATHAQKEITPQEANDFFEAKVRPLLIQKCFSCHGEKLQQSGVRLDSLTAMLKGNSAGPVVIPGEPEKSPLVQVIHYDGKVKMPPSGKLKQEEIEVLTHWIKLGATWPGIKLSDAMKQVRESGAISPEMKQFWSLRPVKKSPVPKVKHTLWGRNSIDAFIMEGLEKKGLYPTPSPDRRNLLRRVTYDLTGLPPTPEEVSAFVTDKSPTAWEKVVDRLLASPRHGERWARHWLDVARYADTRGYNFVSDSVYHHAYNYRDWVVRALNTDMPFDQFVLNQLAADLMPNGEDRTNLAALGFLTLGRRFLNDTVLITDDRIDTVARGLMGLTVNCARCHNHKFDPISQKDYYSLYGVLASVREPEPAVSISPKELREPYEAYQKHVLDIQGRRDQMLREEMVRLRTKMKEPGKLSANVARIVQSLREDALPTEDQIKLLSPAIDQEIKTKLTDLYKQLTSAKQNPPKTPEFAHTVEEQLPPIEPYVFKRGNPGNRGENAKRRFLSVLGGDDAKPFQKGSGRLELAQSIANKENPLTARVFVNRVWMLHFGAALVRTPGDFGTRGELPTHPALLDWLASRFMEEGWSIKKLHKWMVMSNAYKQGSQSNAKAFNLDPENRLVWRQNRQRLDFEAMRDSILNASGLLDPTIGGPAVDMLSAPYTKRRTIYGFVERQNLPGLFRTFDFATPDISTPQRFQTTTPQQALYMMNSPFVTEAVKGMATRGDITSPTTPAAKVKQVYQLLFQRAPTPIEVQAGANFLQRANAAIQLPAWQYGYGGVDASGQKVAHFTPLPFWSGSAWQGSKQMPDPMLSYLLLNAGGGHPGAAADQMVIRRWVSPVTGTVKITGDLKHSEQRGDGVRLRIVSSRLGKLGEWTAFHSTADASMQDVAVKKGDTLDFVVDCKGTLEFDGFNYAPIVSLMGKPGLKTAAYTGVTEWSAQQDFGGPETLQPKGLSAWERYLQALMMTNEFCFVE